MIVLRMFFSISGSTPEKKWIYNGIINETLHYRGKQKTKNPCGFISMKPFPCSAVKVILRVMGSRGGNINLPRSNISHMENERAVNTKVTSQVRKGERENLVIVHSSWRINEHRDLLQLEQSVADTELQGAKIAAILGRKGLLPLPLGKENSPTMGLLSLSTLGLP